MLAVVGLFGVTALVVMQRRREIGIRVAIGATRADVVRVVLMQGLRPVVIGLGAGMGVALRGTPLIGQHVLAGAVSARDPLAFAAAAGILATPATLGVVVPARRALKVDAAAVLKEQ